LRPVVASAHRKRYRSNLRYLKSIQGTLNFLTSEPIVALAVESWKVRETSVL